MVDSWPRLLDLDPPPGEPPLIALPHSPPPTPTLGTTSRGHPEPRVPADPADPAPGDRFLGPDTIAPHLQCPIDHPQRTLLAAATVLTADPENDTAKPQDWAKSILHRYPRASIAAALGQDEATAELRDGSVWHLSAQNVPADALPSALYAWHLAGLSPSDLEPGFTLALDKTTYQVAMQRAFPAGILPSPS